MHLLESFHTYTSYNTHFSGTNIVQELLIEQSSNDAFSFAVHKQMMSS